MKTTGLVVGLGLILAGVVVRGQGVAPQPSNGPASSGPEVISVIEARPSGPAPAGSEVRLVATEALPPAVPAAPTPVGEPDQAPAAAPTPAVTTLPALATPAETVSETVTTLKGNPTGMAPGQGNDNATGRQEPAVSIEWIGPVVAKVGQPVTYQVIIKNISAGPVHDVVIHGKIPTGATVTATEPKAETEDGMLAWKLGDMEPRQEKRLDLQLLPGVTGSITCQASVTLTGVSTARLEIHEPKLAIKATGPKKVIAGDPATVMLTVYNPGDATAEAVKVKAQLSEGLEHAQGKVVEFDLGNLAPNESRNVFVLCAAKGAGEQKCDATATAEPRLTAQQSVALDVLAPKLELTVTGPGMRYLDRHAMLTFKVTNPGSAVASHVTLMDQVPAGFKVTSATGGGQHDFVSRTVAWALGDLPPGQSKEVSLELMAINPGEQKNRAMVTAARGLRAEGEIVTKVEGLPALLMELVDLDDPLEVGAETAYEIRVTNTGTKTETNLQLSCTVPDKMEFRGARGAAGCRFKQEGNEIVFDPLPKLAPRADAIYRVKVKGLAAGDLRFQARMKADGLTVPVLKEESTKVYGDEVEVTGGAVKAKQ